MYRDNERWGASVRVVETLVSCRTKFVLKAKRTKSDRRLIVLDDDAAGNARRRLVSVGDRLSGRVCLRLHEVRDGQVYLLESCSYETGAEKRRGRNWALGLALVERIRPAPGTLLLASARYGSSAEFAERIAGMGLAFVSEVQAAKLCRASASKPMRLSGRQLDASLEKSVWRKFAVTMPGTGQRLSASVTWLDDLARSGDGAAGRVFVVQIGDAAGVRRGTIFGIASSGYTGGLIDLARAVLWVRWVRPAVRRDERGKSQTKTPRVFATSTAGLTARANIATAAQQDIKARALETVGHELRGALGGRNRILNVVELFAGAGGMGLGVLLASKPRRGFRLVASAEVNPVYVETLRQNHQRWEEISACSSRVSEVAPLDLRRSETKRHLTKLSKLVGGVDLLIGGPPCQGFSNANRNSWSSRNANNELVNVFLGYVDALRPAAFVMENVQGILWTAQSGGRSQTASVMSSIEKAMSRLGYVLFPRLLDAAWYGVPQFRSRFFLIGLSRDLGYGHDDFGDWGPYPLPTHGRDGLLPRVTVREAIGDLPLRRNGDGAESEPYEEPSLGARKTNGFLSFLRAGSERGVILDHVTSRHAPYVLDRFRRVPPGGNWRDIADMMSNYSGVERTHSNIYRRLAWSEAAVTIGHYRKSMLIHPKQNRGLSLREAARLQSFPDWFRFAGTRDGRDGGMAHKQQQLANAVCPLVMKALAEFLLEV